jgi:hypothetical protein
VLFISTVFLLYIVITSHGLKASHDIKLSTNGTATTILLVDQVDIAYFKYHKTVAAHAMSDFISSIHQVGLIL